MKRFLFIICLTALGCQQSPEDINNNDIQFNLKSLTNHLEYYRDVNKNVCYSAAFIGYTYAIFTYVPCTPEIERTAHQFHSNQTVR